MFGTAQRVCRRWTTGYLAVLLLALLANGLHLLRTNAGWTIADWLINYQGGFVRRGLIGEFALRLGTLLHLKPPIIVLVIAMLAYILLFYAVWRLTRPLAWNAWFLLLFFSPVTLAFPLISTSGYHKEVLFFAGFALFLLLLQAHSTTSWWLISACLALFTTLIVLCHEPFVVYSPYLVGALYLQDRSWRKVLKVSAIPVLVTGAALVAVATHRGDADIASRVCASLGSDSQWMCQGSIRYLSYTNQEARQDVTETVAHFHYLRFYPPLVLWACLPFAGCFWWLCTNGLPRDACRALAGCFLLSCCLSVVLFLFATDWGRWVQIHLFALFLLFVFAGCRYPSPVRTVVTPRSRVVRLAGGVALALYATCWSLPGYSNIPKAGYISMVQRVTQRAFHHTFF